MGSLSLSEVSFHGRGAALVANGVIDDETVEQFEHALDEAVGGRREPLIVDLTGCQLTSAGLAALIRLQRSPERSPEAMLLVTTVVDLLWKLQVVGLTYSCQIFATLDAATESCSPTTLEVAGTRHE